MNKHSKARLAMPVAPGADDPGDPSAPVAGLALVEREAAVVVSERITDRREEVADRREDAAGLREKGATQRERSLRPREEAARHETELRVDAQARLQEANEALAKAAGQAKEAAEVAQLAEVKIARMANLEAQLQGVQKLETLGALAGGVAHDFNNLLTAIVGNANLGSLALQENGDAAHHFEAIEKAALRAAALTSQLLSYTGNGKPITQEVDLNEVVNEILLLLEVCIPGNVVLHRDLAERLPFVKGDAVQIFQVLMNLITNAGEAFAGGAGGTITIRTRNELVDEASAKGPGWILPLAAGSYAALEVADTGSGMTPEVLAKVFEPYFTTKASGHGLGLAAAVGIIKSHGGGLRVASEPGKGTSFKILLPVMTGVRSVTAPEARPAWRGDGQILLVDKDFEVRRGIRLLASQCGFSVIEAEDGPDAIQAFRLHHEQLTWVLLAVEASLLEWEDVFQTLRAVDPSVPIVLGCGLEFREEDLEDGLAGMLRKPYRAAEFMSLLKRTTAAPVAMAGKE